MLCFNWNCSNVILQAIFHSPAKLRKNYTVLDDSSVRKLWFLRPSTTDIRNARKILTWPCRLDSTIINNFYQCIFIAKNAARRFILSLLTDCIWPVSLWPIPVNGKKQTEWALVETNRVRGDVIDYTVKNKKKWRLYIYRFAF